MKSKFIDTFRLSMKEITKFHMEKRNERPGSIGVQLSLAIKDSRSRMSYKAGEKLDLSVVMTVSLLDANHPDMDPQIGCEEAVCFRCESEYRMLAEFTSDFKSKKPIPEVYSVEILSLVYDDFRNVIEDMINKTEYRGFLFPFDCRAVLDGATITKKED